jgi:pimeloyl-ACP methyl ester carboxylesterase
MPVVFVHGVPETTSVWNPVRSRIEVSNRALALPGFGCPRPYGFGATMDEYADWLVSELANIDGPIDLVGHDWGGILVARVATSGAVELRSWVSDAVVAMDPIFRWHDWARIWQTPGEGERFWAGLRVAAAETATLLESIGVPAGEALAMAEAIDETMCDAILDLYRSATDIGTRWAASGPPSAPGLVLIGSDDAFGNEKASRSVGERLGLKTTVLDGAGHWWPLQVPDMATRQLENFWATLPE